MFFLFSLHATCSACLIQIELAIFFPITNPLTRLDIIFQATHYFQKEQKAGMKYLGDMNITWS